MAIKQRGATPGRVCKGPRGRQERGSSSAADG
jgi:hypothetical protein